LLRKYIDKALVIFPFEEKFYRDRGVDAKFVGHPLADLQRPEVTRDQYAAENGLIASRQWITLMPGSRPKEVLMNLPEILQAADLLGDGYEYVIPVAPTISKDLILEVMKRDCGTVAIHLTTDALPALAYSRAGIVASGTATVEAAIMGTPFVMVYRVSPLTYLLGRSRVKVPYFAMVNLIAGREVVPELVQHDFSAEKVVARLREILQDGPVREQMIKGLAKVRTSLRGPNSEALHPAERAAQEIMAVMRRSTVET
jgi:lipid-A-disaccharide synthase